MLECRKMSATGYNYLLNVLNYALCYELCTECNYLGINSFSAYSFQFDYKNFKIYMFCSKFREREKERFSRLD